MRNHQGNQPIGPEFDLDDTQPVENRVIVPKKVDPEPPVAPLARRPSSVPIALLPAVVLITIATTLLVGRMAIPDWQGLFASPWQATNHQSRKPVPPLRKRTQSEAHPLTQNEPKLEAQPPLTQNEPNLEAQPPLRKTNPIPKPSHPWRKTNPIPKPSHPWRKNEPNLEAQPPLAQNEPNDPLTAAAVDDINREAQRKKAEREELEKLREEAVARADAQPPRRPDRFAPLDRQQREQWVQRQRMIERQMLEEMARAQQEFQKRFQQMQPQPFRFKTPWPPAPPTPRPPVEEPPARPKPFKRPTQNFVSHSASNFCPPTLTDSLETA